MPVLRMLRIFAAREEDCGTGHCGTGVSPVKSQAGRLCHSLVATGDRTVDGHGWRLRSAGFGPRVVARWRCIIVGSLLSMLVIGACTKPVPPYDECIRVGRDEYAAQRYPEAVAMFKHAADIDRERPEASYHMGQCYLAMAERRFSEHNLIGALRNCDRAVACFDDAITAFPGFGRAVQGKAQALRLKGKHAAALEIADWAAQQSGAQARKLILKAHEYAKTGNMDQAQLALKQATSIEADNAAVHAELGLFYLRCDNESAAIGCLQRAYELNPGAPGVVKALAQLNALPETPRRQ